MIREIPVEVALSEPSALASAAKSAEKEKIVATTLSLSRFRVTAVTSSLIGACESLHTLAAAEVSDSVTLEDIEYDFLADFGSNRFLPLAFVVDYKFRRGFHSILRQKLPHVVVEPILSGGKDWERIGGAVLARRKVPDIEPDVPEKSSFFVEEFRKNSEFASRSTSSPTQPVPAPPTSAASDDGTTCSRPPSFNLNAPPYLSDGSCVSRAVQSCFTTVNVDDSSKFGRILAEDPAWDM